MTQVILRSKKIVAAVLIASLLLCGVGISNQAEAADFLNLIDAGINVDQNPSQIVQDAQWLYANGYISEWEFHIICAGANVGSLAQEIFNNDGIGDFYNWLYYGK